MSSPSRVMVGLLAAVIVMVGLGSRASAQQCQYPPDWTVNGLSPMMSTRGNVTVVALLQASCSMCLWQTQRLETINQHLIRREIHDIQFMVVNSASSHSVDVLGELDRRVTFPVYQDTQRGNVWGRLQGGKDDILIYDKCGKLTYHVPYPESLLWQRNFQTALMDTYNNNVCGCHLHGSSQFGHRGQRTHGGAARQPGQGGAARQHGHGGAARQHHTHQQERQQHRQHLGRAERSIEDRQAASSRRLMENPTK